MEYIFLFGFIKTNICSIEHPLILNLKLDRIVEGIVLNSKFAFSRILLVLYSVKIDLYFNEFFWLLELHFNGNC